MNTTGLEIEQIKTLERFNDLETEWNSLAKDQVNTIFLTHAWLSQWWQVFGSDYRLFTLVARKDGALVGVLPLMLSNRPGSFRRLSFMGTGDVTPNHLDAIILPELRAEVTSEFTALLRKMQSEWDILDLDKMPKDSFTVELLMASLRSQGLTPQIEVTARCPYAALPDSFEEFLQSRGLSTRDKYRRAVRVLKRDYPDVRYKRVQTPEELASVMDCLIRLHQRRWTQKGYPGSFADERMARFHHKMALHALQDGSLRMFYLQIAADIVVVRYCYRVADCMQFYLTSFDERLSKYGLGFIIFGYAIEQSIMEGSRRLDFLEGEEEHKARWTTGSLENVRVRVFNPSWQGKLAQARARLTTKIIDLGIRYVPVRIRRPVWQAFLRFKTTRQPNGTSIHDRRQADFR